MELCGMPGCHVPLIFALALGVDTAPEVVHGVVPGEEEGEDHPVGTYSDGCF